MTSSPDCGITNCHRTEWCGWAWCPLEPVPAYVGEITPTRNPATIVDPAEGKNLDGSVRRETVELNPKDIAGSKKPQLALIPLQDDVAAVYELGARKYGPFNWRYTPIGLHAYLNAILRHTQAVINGEDIDQESGKSHLAHVAATAMIVLDAKAHGSLKEDRPTVVEIKPAGKEAA